MSTPISAPVVATDGPRPSAGTPRGPQPRSTTAVLRPDRRRREPVAATARAALALLYGLPLVWVVLTSLKRQGDVLNPDSLLTFTPTLEAYGDILANGGLVTAAVQSAQIAVGTTALVVVLGAPLAYALAKVRGAWTGLVLGALVFLQMVPQTSSVIPLYSMFARLGLLDTTGALILADTALLLPWATLLLRPFFVAVPEAVEEAASLDGAGALRTFWWVVLPMARNGISTVAALIFLVSWGEFLYAINLFITPVNYPMSALIAQQTSGYGINWPGLMALAVLSSVPLLAVYVVAFRRLREGLAVGSVK